MIIHLTDRGILGLKGKDVAEFLQGTITQDMRLLETQPLIYGHTLSAKGRFMHDFFISKQDDFYLLDCPKNEVMALAKHLHEFVITKQVEFHDLSADYNIFAGFEAAPDEATADPRPAPLGWRLILPKSQTLEAIQNLEEYHRKRIALGVPDGGYDGFKERTLANEMCGDLLNAISFNKGCYVGQELTARTKHRTEAKKRFYIATFEGEPMPAGSPAFAGKMEAGWLFSQQKENGQTQALLLMRTRYFEQEITLEDGRVLTLKKPDWATY